MKKQIVRTAKIAFANSAREGEIVPDVLVIDLWLPTAQCCICGEWDISKWGVPISSETGLIIGNDSEEEWAANSACKKCWALHEEGQFVGLDPKF